MDTRKAIALLAYLAITEKTHSRETLAALLWPESDQSHGLASLRRTLSTLRKGFGEENLQVTRDALAVNPEADIWLDVDEFERLLGEIRAHGHPEDQLCPMCLPLLQEAAELYSKDFMEGFNLRDTPGYDDWKFFESERLRRLFADTLERLVRGLSERGNYASAIEYAARWVSLDELHEPAHRWLMRLYAWNGQRNAALRQYRECIRILEQELSVAPAEETQELYQALLENRVPDSEVGSPELTSLAPPAQGEIISHFAYPLVGRSGAWSALQEAYELVAEQGYLLALRGEAGIGKTRLVDEFRSHLQNRGLRILSARCHPAEKELAFSPLVQSIRSQLHQGGDPARLEQVESHWLAGVSRLLPEVAPGQADALDADEPAGPGAQSRLFESLMQVMTGLLDDGPGPGLLYLDDLHWADASSLAFITYLRRRLDRFPHLIVLTWRKTDHIFDHPLRSLSSDLRRSSRASLYELDRLSPEDVSTLLRGSVPETTSLPENIDDRLYQETEGLPYFVVGYIDMIQEGVLEEWPVPSGALDLMHSRLAGLHDTALQVLQAAAVLGRAVDPETVRRVSGRSEEETISALEALSSRGLLNEIEEGSSASRPRDALSSQGFSAYDFPHGKLRDAIYTETSLARKRVLHRRAAEFLSRATREPSRAAVPAATVALHYERAGDEREAARFHKTAGDEARRIFANQDAVQHYQRALGLGHPELAKVHEAVGDMRVLVGEYDQALHSFETAAAHFETATDMARLAHKIGNLHHRRGEWTLAASHFENGLEQAGQDRQPDLRARLLADWSRTAHQSGDAEHARELAERALSEAKKLDSSPSLARAHNILGLLQRESGDTVRAVKHLERAIEIAQANEHRGLQIAAWNNLALQHKDEGDLKRARSLLKDALELCRQLGDRHHEAALLNNLADVYHAEDNTEQAMTYLKDAVRIFTEIGVDSDRASAEIWKLKEW